MSRSTNEEWERRKWYLVRNLFEDVLLLSPIPETQEQSFDLRSPTEAALRPYSPLPDLIIEKEPNRHDETEEFYQELEKKIKKIYRRLFLETGSSDSSTEEIDEMIFRGGIGTKAAVEAILPEHSNIGRNQSSEEGCSREETIASAEQMTESSNSSSGDRSGSTESFDSSSIKRSKSHESANRSSVEHSETNESNEHSGVNSNASAKSSKSENNEECLIEEKSISTRSLEENDTSSMSTSHQEIIVTQAQIHDAGKKQIESASHMKLASSLDKVSSEQDYFPRISHHEKNIRPAQIQDGGSKQQAEKAEEAHMGPTTPLDNAFEEVYLPSTSHHEIIVTQAEIHDTTALSPLERAREDDPPVIIGSEKRDESKSTDIIARVTNTEVSEAEHERSELESLQSSNNREEIIEFAVPSVHSDASSLDEPEAMRRQRTSNLSVHSPNSFNGRRYSSTGIDFENREQSAREMEEETGDFSLISEPKRKSISQEERHSRRRILSEISTSHKPSKRSKRNLATQTSFSSCTDVENNWEEIRTNFFEGNPVIYKLCTCNHVCR